MYRNFKHIILIFSFLIAANLSADNGEQSAIKTASDFIETNNKTEIEYTIDEDYIEITKDEKLIALAFNIAPTGFVVINLNSNEVIAYSFDNYLPNFDSPEWEMFSGLISSINPKNNLQTELNKRANFNANSFEIGPFIYSLWGQVNCKDNYGNTVNVSNLFTPNNYAVGCVAVSMSTLMQHYNWPINGSGSHTYSDNYGSSKGTYSADFENTEYPWNNMLNRYNNKVSTQIEREAAGLLNFHAAVALDMDFEYNGSTSNINRISNAGRNYFRYSSQNRYPSSSVFWPLLDSNMIYEIPVILAIAGNGYGHSIVCDGMRIEEDSTFYYHLNMGWWGSANGWYRLKDNWNAGGYSEITGGVFNFLPIPSLETPYFEETSDSLTVKWEYPETPNFNAFELQMSVNDGNWETIVDTITQKYFTVIVDTDMENKFRVKAKNNGLWSTDSWSFIETAIWDNTSIFENHNTFNISISPNPVRDFITVKTSSRINTCQIQIFELSGKEVFRTSVFNEINSQKIDVSKLKPGLYLLYCKSSESMSSIKFIKL